MSCSDSEAANQPHAGDMRNLNARFHLPSAPSAITPSNVLNRRAHCYHPPPAITPRFPSLDSAFTSRELTAHAKQHLSLLTSTRLQSDVDLDPSQRTKQKRKKAVKGFMRQEEDSLCKSWLPVHEEGAVQGRVATKEGAARVECLEQDEITLHFAAVLTLPVGENVILDPSTCSPFVSSCLDGTSLACAALARMALASAPSSMALASAAAVIPFAHTAKNIDTALRDQALMPASLHHRVWIVWIDQVPAPCPARKLTKSLYSAHLFCACLTLQMVSKLGVGLC